MSAFIKVLNCLPPSMSLNISNTKLSSPCQEIRIIRNKRVVLVTATDIKILEYICTDRDLDIILKNLCHSSLYAHEDTINRGFISFDEGVRVGVCGHAATENGKLLSVRQINSLNIRIPINISPVCAPLISAIEHYNFRGSILVFSPPGVGKTTLLRQTAAALSNYPYLKRVSLIDPRGELSIGCEESITLDVYKYYPIGDAVEMAVRTMTPEFIVCDEIGGEKEENALLSCTGKGVCLIASAHGDSFTGILNNPFIAKLHLAGVFTCYCMISRQDFNLTFKFKERSELMI